jgi:hypothetical protein
MPRRVDLPGADALFRRTASADPAADAPTPSGRVRHEEKITVYVTSDELIALEQARLLLRAQHGVVVDRGRIVRAAVGLAMADLAERGAESELVRRLDES